MLPVENDGETLDFQNLNFLAFNKIMVKGNTIYEKFKTTS